MQFIYEYINLTVMKQNSRKSVLLHDLLWIYADAMCCREYMIFI